MILEHERLRLLRILCFFMKYFEAQATRFKCELNHFPSRSQLNSKSYSVLNLETKVE